MHGKTIYSPLLQKRETKKYIEMILTIFGEWHVTLYASKTQVLIRRAHQEAAADADAYAQR